MIGTAASFGNALKAYAQKSDVITQKVIESAITLAFDSVLEGAPLTGAPGQPVDTGALQASWHQSFRTAEEVEFSSLLPYAWGIENGIGPYGPLTLRSNVGGFHSVKYTVAAWPRIVRHAVKMHGMSR